MIEFVISALEPPFVIVRKKYDSVKSSKYNLYAKEIPIDLTLKISILDSNPNIEMRFEKNTY